jgi:NCS1 family nucleobase:cation symporter-1
MIAAVGSVLITPWNLYNNPEVIHYTLEILGAFIGPLFGVLIADYYLVKKQRIVVDDLFTMSKAGTYWYKGGYNPKAVVVTVISGAVAVFPVLFGNLPGMTTAAQYSWFIGCGLAFALYWAATRNSPAPAASIGDQEPVGAV